MTSIFRTQVKGSVLPLEDVLQSTSGAASVKTTSGLSIQETLDAILAALAGGGVPTPIPGSGSSDSFAYVSVNDWSQYITGQENSLDYGLRIKLDKVAKKLYLNFKGFKTTPGNPPANFVFYFQVSGASLTFVTKTGDLTTLSYSMSPLTFSSADNNKWSTNGSYITASLADSEEKEYVFTLSSLSNNVFFKFSCVSVEAFSTNTFLSCGDRLLNVNPSANFKFGFNSVDNQVNSISWDNVVGPNKPQDNATYGSTWDAVLGIGKPEDFATSQRIFLQASQPESGVTFEDIWIDSSDGNHQYLFDVATNSWTSIRDTAIQQAIDTANEASSQIEAKVTVYYQDTVPGTSPGDIPPSQNDLWINLSNEKQLMVYRYGAWNSARDDQVGIAFSNANYALSEVIKKSSCFIMEADPRSVPDSGVTTGTLWLDLNANGLKIFDAVIDDWRQVSRYVDSTSQLSDDAGLGRTAEWGWIYGVGKPQNFATNTMTFVQNFPPEESSGTSPFNSSYQWVDTTFNRNWPRYWNIDTGVWDIKRDIASVDFEDHRDDLVRDDHLQYFNQSRGDARYYTRTQVDDMIDGVSAINRPVSVSSDYVIKSWEFVVADARTDAFDLSLPAEPEENDVIKVFKYGTHSLNILGNGNSIENQAGISIDDSRAHLCLIYLGTELGWAILYNIVPSPAFLTHVFVLRGGFDFGSNSGVEMGVFTIGATYEDFEINSNIQLDVDIFDFAQVGEDFGADSRGVAIDLLTLGVYPEFEADVHFVNSFDLVDLLEVYDAVSRSHFEVTMPLSTAWTVSGYSFSVNSRGLELDVGLARPQGIDFNFASHKEYMFMQNVVFLDYPEFDFNSNFAVDVDLADVSTATFAFDVVSNGTYVEQGYSSVTVYEFEADSRGVHVEISDETIVAYDFSVLYRSVDFDTYQLVITTPTYYAEANGLMVDFEDVGVYTNSFAAGNPGLAEFDLYNMVPVTYEFGAIEHNIVDFDELTIPYIEYDFSVESHSGPAPARVAITTPTTSVTASLTGFPLFVDLGEMPVGFWDEMVYETGADIRVKTAGGVDIPFHLVNVSKTEGFGFIFIKRDLNTTTSDVVYIHLGAGTSSIASSDSIGMREVWSNYRNVLMADVALYDAAPRDVGYSFVPSFSASTYRFSQYSPEVIPGDMTDFTPTCLFGDGTYYYMVGKKNDQFIAKYNSSWVLQGSVLDLTSYVGSSVRARMGFLKDNMIHYYVLDSAVHKIRRVNTSDLSFASDVVVTSDFAGTEVIGISDSGEYVYSVSSDGTTLKRYLASDYSLDEAVDIEGLSTIATNGSILAVYERNGRIVISVDNSASPMIVLVKEESSPDVYSAQIYFEQEGYYSYLGPALVPDSSIKYIGYNTPEVRLVEIGRFVNDTPTVYGLKGGQGGVLSYPTQPLTSEGVFTIETTMSQTVMPGTEDQIHLSFGEDLMAANSVKIWTNYTTGKLTVTDAVNGDFETGHTVVEGQLIRVSVVYNGTSRKVYVNGTEYSGSAITALTGTKTDILLGVNETIDGNWSSADMEVITLVDAALSPAYIQASHSNLTNPSAFYSVGSLEYI